MLVLPSELLRPVLSPFLKQDVERGSPAGSVIS
jgi:hypothetical protein